MKANSLIKPKTFDKYTTGKYLYRYNVQEVEVPSEEGDQTQTQYEYDEVIVNGPLTEDNIFAAVMVETWSLNHEQKLVNEYNAYVNLGLGSEDAISVYNEFLAKRDELKNQVIKDCEIYGII